MSDAILPLESERGGQFGSAVALDHGYLLIGGQGHEGTVPTTGTVFFVEENYLLPAADLIRCSSPVTLPTALATDHCAGTVMGTSPESTTFDAAGNYSRVWNFGDGRGNFSSAVQAVKVSRPDLSLPYSITTNNDSRRCWSADDGLVEGLWSATQGLLQPLVGKSAFAINGTVLGSHAALLNSPNFDLSATVEYLISFQQRTLQSVGTEGLRLTLIDVATGEVVKQLLRDEAAPHGAVTSDLIFTVPADGTYRLGFQAWGGLLSPGLKIDEILIQEHTVATGWPGLAGRGDDTCQPAAAKGLNGFAFSRFLGPDGKLVAEIDPNGNDLGDVNIAMTDYQAVPVAPFTQGPVLSRYFDIVPEHGSGPYTANGGVKVRLYFSPAELDQFNQYTQGTADWDKLTILHYSDQNQDCDINNSMGGDFRFEQLQSAAAFSSEGHYLEFYTTSFSEFSASTEAASTQSASSLPVVLTDFTGEAEAGGNRVDWFTETERDFSHYLVEKSRDGRRFESLQRVDGQGLPHYTVMDKAAFPVTYYRLHMVDLDGSAAYSAVIRIARGSDAGSLTASAYPVPTDGTVTVSFTLSAPDAVELSLTAPDGRSIRRHLYDGTVGENLTPVDLSDLPAGTYYLSLRSRDLVRNLLLIRR